MIDFKEIMLMLRLYSCPKGVSKDFFTKVHENGGSYDEFVHLFGYKSRSKSIKNIFDKFLESGIIYYDTEITTTKVISYYRINKKVLRDNILENPNYNLIFNFTDSVYIVLQLKGKN